MPDLPSWSGLVSALVNEAQKEGVIDENTATALLSEDSDFLYVIDEIYSGAGKGQTKAKVAKIFSSLERPNEAHSCIVGTNFDRLMTLNYDQGLEIAFAENLTRHVTSITPRQINEVDSWLRKEDNNAASPILHWHGLASDAESIILSGSDYVEFYEIITSNKETLRNIFKTRRVLMIGFGFSDPFIERELNSVMQPLPKNNSHFAIIGLPTNSINTPLERRKYNAKYKLETIFYPIKDTDNGPDHSAILGLLEEIRSQRPRKPILEISQSKQISIEKNPNISYRSNLFSIGDNQIYCEPNLWSVTKEENGSTEAKAQLSDIASGDFHCCIEAPREYGLTNLGRKLAWDLELSGKRVFFRDAHNFPKYKKAILSDSDFSDLPQDTPFTIILDNFSAVDHQRTIREIISAYANTRIIILSRANFDGTVDDGISELNFQSYQLRGLTRADIRAIVNVIAPDYNTDTKSSIVDKIYSDLLQLCIPLTPSNVIMYSSVLCKDGSFSPVSRLHIVEKFTSNALVRSSDAYADTFNFINKLDLIGEFCSGLFSQNKATFTNSDWSNFCSRFKTENLVEFSTSEILSDLVNGRIVWRDGPNFQFRYRMFFSYFVGRHISSHANLLQSCLEQNRHLELDGLVEVLCGTLNDATTVLEDLTAKLATSLFVFYKNYPIANLDFHENIRWERSNKEGAFWDAVSDRVEGGPASSQELDELKTSIQAERRTIDQKVSIIKFITSEKSVASIAWSLQTALESAKNATAAAKKAAAIEVIRSHTLAYEVASVFVPLIAEKKYVSWNGFTYINLIEDKDVKSTDPDKSKEAMKNLVALSLPFSVADSVANVFGNRKLGQVFLALIDNENISTKVKKFFLFSLIIRSKPGGWLSKAKGIISGMSREDIYLKHILTISINQFKHEINTESERLELKELIAAIRLRRDINLKIPSATEIKRAIGKLDAKGYWEEEKAGADGEPELGV